MAPRPRSEAVAQRTLRARAPVVQTRRASALFVDGMRALFGVPDLVAFARFARRGGFFARSRNSVLGASRDTGLFTAEFSGGLGVSLAEDFLARVVGRARPHLPARLFSRGSGPLATGLALRSRFRRLGRFRSLLRFHASPTRCLRGLAPSLRLSPFGSSSLHFSLHAGNLREQRALAANVPL